MITVTTPPSHRAINIDLVKEHLRILSNDDDATLELYTDSAIDIFERYTNIALITQTVKQTIDCFPTENYFLLERKPVISITHIKYYDEDNTLQTFSSDNYLLAQTEPPKICLATSKTWPSDIHKKKHGSVEITYQAGYGVSDSYVPADIKMALSLLIGDLYEKREDTIAMPGVTITPTLWHSKILMQKYKPYYFEHQSQQRGSIYGN